MAGQRSPGARRGSSTDGLDVTSLPWMKQHASFDAEIYGQMEGATSRDGGDNPGDTIIPDIYRDVLTGQIGEIRSRSGSDVAKIRLGS